MFGKHIKIFIASGDEYEGTDLKALQYIHLAEPLLDPLKERQVVGRGVRFCAHEQLPLGQPRVVTIVRWYLEPPPLDSRRNLLQGLPSSKLRAASNIAASVRHLEQEYGHLGYEMVEWNKSMTTRPAVDLHNFEKIMSYVARGKTTYTLGKRFVAVAGRPCAP
jgi:hypothetical protein